MWAFAEAVRGIGDACRALNTPVTGGNVSFYNESADSSVYPSPVIGVVGVLDDYRLLIRQGFPSGGLVIYLLGRTLSELGGTEYGEAILGKVSGRPPRLDLDAEGRLHRLLCECARQDLLASAHDLSDGGMAVALAESSIVGGLGFTVSVQDDGLDPHVALFSETASRALVTARPGREGDVEQLAGVHQIPITRLGLTGGSRQDFADLFDVALSDAVVVYEGALPRLMSAHRVAG